MISKVFLAYILIAHGAVPACLVANTTSAADAEVPGTPHNTLAPGGLHSATQATPANSAAAEHPPSDTTATSSGPKSGNATDAALGHTQK
ncbi:hypothetical protein PGTUg99_007211 [Puccinia graminis f. sp. tritici]|uniref:Secreted protein n=1 Tax=Puccinia graminis f. sp. tritici TaxID=56615 RepID=A0A5B0M4Q8_PUCGR|nr:hypothetical protein PGTUg99_007211 [Puccinia graminis f. sp. tritici]